MFERFTDRARRAVVLAQEEARGLNHDYIGTEHLLLGLCREGEGVASRALESLGVSVEDVRTEVRAIVGEGASEPAGHVPFTPPAKKVLELALREALQLGHNYIGTEHILLGLVRLGEGVAVQVLDHRGADPATVRRTVEQLLAESPDSTQERPPNLGELLRGRRSRRALEAGTEEREFPICPSCSASLAERASIQTRELVAEGDPTVIRIAYCAACGVALGVSMA